MNRDDVEAWKVNLQGVLDETNSNLKKFRELDRVDTHPNIDYDENGLDGRTVFVKVYVKIKKIFD